jgi:hypothetical protein
MMALPVSDGRDVEGDVVDGEQGAAAGREFDPQVADFEERLVVRCGGHLS